jgi:hypothetical protein
VPVAARQRTIANPIDTLNVVLRRGIIRPLFLADTRPPMRSFTGLDSLPRACCAVISNDASGVEDTILAERHGCLAPEWFVILRL